MNSMPRAKFQKGQTVWIELHGAGTVSHQKEQVGEVKDGEVWIDNGPGNDPTGPFDTVTGNYLGDTFPGFSQKIVSERPKRSKKR